MINNMPEEPELPKEDKSFDERYREYVSICSAASAEGTVNGVFLFINKNNVNCSPVSGDGNTPILHFVDLLTAELDKEPEAKGRFPFEKSFAEHLKKKMSLDRDNFQALYSFGFIDELKGLVRLAASAATAEYLEDNREPALKLMRKLRGVE